MHRISIIHFQPLEFFPPALNFIRYLSSCKNVQVFVSTTRRDDQPFRTELPGEVELKVTNVSVPGTSSRLGRMINYFHFTFTTIRQLLAARPEALVYFDPYSALPGIIYKLLLGRNVKVWVHFHEYFPPDWYTQGMLTVRVTHFLEQHYIFSRALGISHTNSKRVEMFSKDNPGTDRSKLSAFPNYPSLAWAQHQRRITEYKAPTRFVALGSLTLKDTYIGEFCTWVERQNGKVQLDIYSLYFDEETKSFLEQRNPSWIRFHQDGIPYDQIPSLFEESNFHIGLVLYRCDHINTIHCASNKLFEYLVCGLDVWYPREMIGTDKYATDGVYPKVLPINFKCLNEIDVPAIRSRDGHEYVRRDYNCESVYSNWAAKLVELN